MFKLLLLLVVLLVIYYHWESFTIIAPPVGHCPRECPPAQSLACISQPRPEVILWDAMGVPTLNRTISDDGGLIVNNTGYQYKVDNPLMI
jgi:hypothetical protein